MWSISFWVCPSLEIQEKWWISFLWNQDPAMLRWCPLQNDSRRSVFTFGVPLPRGLVLCHPVFFYCVWQHWSRRESPWGRSYCTAQWQPQGLRRTAPWLKCLHFLSEHTQQWMTEIQYRAWTEHAAVAKHTINKISARSLTLLIFATGWAVCGRLQPRHESVLSFSLLSV